MAIEIIKAGKLPEAKKAVVDCSNCSTKFSLLMRDGIKKSDPRDGTYIIAKCPLCSRDVFVAISLFI